MYGVYISSIINSITEGESISIYSVLSSTSYSQQSPEVLYLEQYLYRVLLFFLYNQYQIPCLLPLAMYLCTHRNPRREEPSYSESFSCNWIPRSNSIPCQGEAERASDSSLDSIRQPCLFLRTDSYIRPNFRHVMYFSLPIT